MDLITGFLNWFQKLIENVLVGALMMAALAMTIIVIVLAWRFAWGLGG